MLGSARKPRTEEDETDAGIMRERLAEIGNRHQREQHREVVRVAPRDFSATDGTLTVIHAEIGAAATQDDRRRERDANPNYDRNNRNDSEWLARHCSSS